MREGIDLDDLTIKFRKATPKRFQRVMINVKKGKAKITITDEERYCSLEDVVTIFNHEFFHWILCNYIGVKWGISKYDDFLEVLGWYWLETLEEMKL